jgi:hypothetical protein
VHLEPNNGLSRNSLEIGVWNCDLAPSNLTNIGLFRVQVNVFKAINVEYPSLAKGLRSMFDAPNRGLPLV